MKTSFLRIAALAVLTATPFWAAPAKFSSPQEAFDAMIDALRQTDRQAVLEVFGEEAQDYLSDSDPVEDKINRRALHDLYREGYRIIPQENGAVMVALGQDGWLFPIPIAKTGTAWSFDNAAGREDVLARQIGRNELDVIELLEAYVTIQSDFRSVDQDGDGLMEFARQIIATSAQERDGLFWADEDTPLGEVFARASVHGYNDGTADHAPEPFLGYYYRILTAQSDAAPGGKMDYIVNGNMVAGHAILAIPAIVGETGIHSFMVSENGVVLETVLGEDTLDVASGITSFNPTSDWAAVE
ncbi:MAG: DUF2950 family protein [Roseobacter sp.]